MIPVIFPREEAKKDSDWFQPKGGRKNELYPGLDEALRRSRLDAPLQAVNQVIDHIPRMKSDEILDRCQKLLMQGSKSELVDKHRLRLSMTTR